MSIEEEMDRLRTFFSELYQVTAAGATGNAKVTHILRIRTKLRPRSMAHSGEHGDDQLIQAQAEFAQFGAYMKAGLPSSTGAPSGATSTAPSLGDTEATEDQSKEMDVDRDRRRTQRDEGEINPPPQKWAKGDQKGVDKPQEPVSGKGGQVLKDNVEPSTRTPGSGSTQPIPTPSPTTAARDKETRTDRDRKQDQNQDTRRSQQNRSWNQQHGYRSWPTRRGDKEDLKEVIRAMGRLSLRLEDQLSVFSLDVEFILFLQTDSSGNKFSITASLYAAAQQWHRQKESDPASLTQPMRNILLYCLFSALLERLEKLETDPDMMAQVRKHIKAQVEPLSHREAVESVRVLLRLTTFPHVVGRFHALRKLTAAPSGDVIPFTLMAQNRTAESHQLYTLMHRLARNSVWHLIGSTMRPTKIGRSPLAKQLDKMIQHAACDLPPWLPLQVSRFNAAHEKITTPVHFSPAIYLPVFTGTSKFSGHYRTALCQSGQLRFLTDDGVEATQEPTHVGDADRHPCFDVAENPGRVTSLSTSMACLSPQSFEMGAKTTDFGTPINAAQDKKEKDAKTKRAAAEPSKPDKGVVKDDGGSPKTSQAAPSATPAPAGTAGPGSADNKPANTTTTTGTDPKPKSGDGAGTPVVTPASMLQEIQAVHKLVKTMADGGATPEMKKEMENLRKDVTTIMKFLSSSDKDLKNLSDRISAMETVLGAVNARVCTLSSNLDIHAKATESYLKEALKSISVVGGAAKTFHADTQVLIGAKHDNLEQGIKSCINKVTNCDYESHTSLSKTLGDLSKQTYDMGQELLAALHFVQGEQGTMKDNLWQIANVLGDTVEQVRIIRDYCERPVPVNVQASGPAAAMPPPPAYEPSIHGARATASPNGHSSGPGKWDHCSTPDSSAGVKVCGALSETVASAPASGLAALAPLAEGMYQLKLNSCRSGDCATRFEGFLNIIREVWKTTCIGIVKDSNYESERAVMCFVTLHFLLLCLAQDHPQLREHTAATVREFLERIDAAPSENLKTAVPDLGRFLVRFLLMESELSLRDHLAPIVRELFRRNVRWVHPDHWADGDASEDEKEEQVDAAFEASQFGMKPVNFLFPMSNMSITVEVRLLSGKTAEVKASLAEKVGLLKRRAQTALGVGRGRLLDSSGNVLDACDTVKGSGLQNYDSLTLHISRVQVLGAANAFATLFGDGSVVTSGHFHNGGDSSAVQDQLRNVQQMQNTDSAFAAILGDSSVVVWGDARFGGESRAAQARLKNVQQIQASRAAFAAILGDGSVVSWGYVGGGGDSSAVQDQLKDVQQIQASGSAFAAILSDGSVVTWGNARFGGDSGAVQDQLKKVRQIQATGGSFAAILCDGSVVTWGDARFGGDSRVVQEQLKNVQQIQANERAFAAILGDGSVATWGHFHYGGDSSAVQDQLRNVQQIQSSLGAFAAILGGGTVVTWGQAEHGGDSNAVQDQLKTVQHIQANSHAFAAILGDGSVVTWGNARLGGDSSAVQDQLKDVRHIQSAAAGAFAAILADGSVVTWGDADCGGDSSAVQDQLRNVQQIQSSTRAFAAVVGDGSVVTWGVSTSCVLLAPAQDLKKLLQRDTASKC
ncbi:HERC1 [Symbiodinium sp. KB8]|nr:HERC1 [Symbiodinium sp. KB8]